MENVLRQNKVISYEMNKHDKTVDKPNVPRKKVTVSVDEKLVEWADKLVSEGYKYKDRSHVVEYALSLLKKREEKEE